MFKLINPNNEIEIKDNFKNEFIKNVKLFLYSELSDWVLNSGGMGDLSKLDAWELNNIQSINKSMLKLQTVETLEDVKEFNRNDLQNNFKIVIDNN